jgi:hypothetical protein
MTFDQTWAACEERSGSLAMSFMGIGSELPDALTIGYAYGASDGTATFTVYLPDGTSYPDGSDFDHVPQPTGTWYSLSGPALEL